MAAQDSVPPPQTRARAPRRGALRADQGDTCDISDSALLRKHKEALNKAAQSSEFAKLPDRFKQAFLNSTVVVRMADLLAAFTERELVPLLVQLAQVIGDRVKQGQLGVASREELHIAATLTDMAQESVLDEAQRRAFAIHAHCMRVPYRPLPAVDVFAAHAAAEKACNAAGGPHAEWRMDTFGLRTMQGSFSAGLEAPKLAVSFDDGCAMCLVSTACLKLAGDSLLTPNPPLLAGRPESKPGIMALQNSVKVCTVAGHSCSCYYVVQVHLKLARAVYDVRLLLTNYLPDGGVFLGQNFLWEFALSSCTCRQCWAGRGQSGSLRG